MKIISHILSFIFHPLLMPVLSFALMFKDSYLNVMPMYYKSMITSIVGVFTLVIPCLFIFLLKILKVISSVSLYNRKDRMIPYLITILSYFTCAITLYKLRVPLWMLSMLIGAALALINAMFITMKWKISAHATGMGGMMGAVIYLFIVFGAVPLWLLSLVILASGAVGTARIYLNCHTFGQVIAGYANGLGWVLLLMMITSYFG